MTVDGEGNPVRNVLFSHTHTDGKEKQLSGYNNPDLDSGSSYGKQKVLVIRDPITKNEHKGL